MISPGFSTLPDDCSDQPSRNVIAISGMGDEVDRLVDIFADWDCVKANCEIRKTKNTDSRSRSFIRPLFKLQGFGQAFISRLINTFQ
jgi:hypothetical protein